MQKFHNYNNWQIDVSLIVQFAILIITKTILEISFSYFLAPLNDDYSFDFSIFKYCNGWVWFLLIFIAIGKIDNKKVSTLFLYLHFYIGIVPIICIYAFMNQNSVFFNCVCGLYFFIVMIMYYFDLQIIKAQLDINIFYRSCSNIIIIGSVGILIFVVIYIMYKNGLPSSGILNLLDVYKIRASYFISNKYVNYLYDIVNYAIMPFLFGYCAYKKRYVLMTLLAILVYVFYLYSGNKTTLFSLIILIAVFICSNVVNANKLLMNLFSIGITGCSVLWMVGGSYMPYSLFVRRMLLDSAINKFFHFEFMLENPVRGFSGTILGKITGENSALYNGILFDESIPLAIGRIFYGSEVSANTGFLIEGFERFGYLGFIVTGVAFVICLKAIDRLQKNTTYQFALIATIYFVFSLNDKFLIDSMLFGPGLYIIVLACFFKLDEDNKLIESREGRCKR